MKLNVEELARDKAFARLIIDRVEQDEPRGWWINAVTALRKLIVWK